VVSASLAAPVQSGKTRRPVRIIALMRILLPRYEHYRSENRQWQPLQMNLELADGSGFLALPKVPLRGAS
jgi:hypothetical protein